MRMSIALVELCANMANTSSRELEDKTTVTFRGASTRGLSNRSLERQVSLVNGLEMIRR
jgi:hypothetical protein